jgi:hypothetical protein
MVLKTDNAEEMRRKVWRYRDVPGDRGTRQLFTQALGSLLLPE